jgi:hypothetical protein
VLTPLDGNAHGVSAVKKPHVDKAKHDCANGRIKQIMTNSPKAFGFSLSSRPSIRTGTPLTLSQFFFRGAEIRAAPAIDLSASCE